MSTPQERLFALALYHMRLQLSHKFGACTDGDLGVSLAANLAYALHNNALDVLEGRAFDIEQALERIEGIDRLLGTRDCRQLAEQIRTDLAAQKPDTL
ncbi:hypothetical protein JFV28_11710 [Pseudomonas sp. TH05]|uniref:hypothetical protein n=1 Tax=unclassified Pseudomonas TaxID=196821 RepID=UPI001914001C|nr:MULTISPECIES: hypothetical protein [unclassified Pseudomonas]MBK5540572.1 hypothetical protein [Pseudomonas sp. TH07]MBK5556530.1 hypothetical protein [Pseudomonas sp. TH05]